MTSLAKSTKIVDYRSFNWSVGDKDCIKYPEIINFERRAGAKGEHRCVMCGNMKGPDCVIPNQNKDVCKTCDSSFWLLNEQNVLVKFCKGCKKFSALSDFDEKPEASKCGKCRKRGRQNYYSRKQDEDENAGGVSAGVGVNLANGAAPMINGHQHSLTSTAQTGTNRTKQELKPKEKKKTAVKSKKEKPLKSANGVLLNKKALNKLLSKDAMNDSGETDKSSLNLTSSTSSESCPSPNSYHISNSSRQPHHLHHTNYHHQNHSFSSPSFHDTSDLDMLGFHPYDNSVDMDPHHDVGKSANHSDGEDLQVPFPFRPLDSGATGGNTNGGRSSSQYKASTPTNRVGGGETTCPDTCASIVSCSSQISEGGGVYFSNSLLWGDSLKEIERNSMSNREANRENGKENGQVAGHSSTLTANNLLNNSLSCFQLPTGHPSTAKKPRPGAGSMKGVGYPPDSAGRGQGRGHSNGVAMDRRGSKGSSSGKSSKNSSLSSIGSAGGFPINHFGDLGGIGNTSQANTPGLLLSITPQPGMNFTPGPAAYDVITPFTGTPMFSTSPFDSINTPDSNWKWDPSANALMNLASLSAEVLTNSPPADGSSEGQDKQNPTGVAATTNTESESAPPRKCASDPGKSTAAHSLPPTNIPPSLLVNTEANRGTSTSTGSVPSSSAAGPVPELDGRTREVSDPQVEDSTGSPFPHIHTEDNIYQVALDPSQSFELSPTVPPLDKKRSFQEENEDNESIPLSASTSVPAKKLRL